MSNAPQIDDTFAEAFPMRATRLIITAFDEELVKVAASEFCGNASSVIGCDAEVGVERYLNQSETIDGRPGVAILAFALIAVTAARTASSVSDCVLPQTKRLPPPIPFTVPATSSQTNSPSMTGIRQNRCSSNFFEN